MKTTLILLLQIVMVYSYSQKDKGILLNHSTGKSIYNNGGVQAWILDYNSKNGTSYSFDRRDYPNDPYSWRNYSYDYWNLWVKGECDNNQPGIECLSSLASDYELIVFKHCYPGARIIADDAKPDITSKIQTIANYKLQYRALRDELAKFDNNKFIIWTLVPNHRMQTDVDEAARANEFVEWVKTEWLHEGGKSYPNIYVFDYFGYSAEMNSSPENGMQYCLKYEYEKDHSDGDSHPNVAACEKIGHLLAEAVVQVFSGNVPSAINNKQTTNARMTFFAKGNAEYQLKFENDLQLQKLSVYNSLGKVYLIDNNLYTEKSFDFSSASKGVYIVVLEGDSKIYSKKIIVN